MTSTDLSYEAWQTAFPAALAFAVARLDKLYDDTLTYARHQSALHRRNPTPASKKRADDAWALARLRECGIDFLGEPIDPTHAGRAKWERSFLLATGVPWTHPEDDDTPPEHAAGDHAGTTLRHSYDGDLPSCSACMEDEDWHLTQTYALNARRNRKASR